MFLGQFPPQFSPTYMVHDSPVQVVVQDEFLRVPHKNLADSVLDIVGLDGRVARDELFHVVHSAVPPVLQQDTVLLDEPLVFDADRVAGTADTDSLQHAGVSQLAEDDIVIEVVGNLKHPSTESTLTAPPYRCCF